MAQITEEHREQRIKELLQELEKYPPEQHEIERIPWTGGEYKYCKVISIGADDVLLNPNSHRLQSQLQDDSAWVELSKAPYSEAAQKVIAEHVRKARSADKFSDLVESLRVEGQQQPGVMTHKGVLINANTRAVAIREFDDPQKRYLRVAVLPATALPGELAVLELQLQMQKELKEDYSLTNELLFVEEMHKTHKMGAGQIARHLRFQGKKGEQEVELRLKLLDLIRLMQAIPKEPLRLTFFDKVALQQLRDLHIKWEGLSDRDPRAARRLLESWVLSVASGVSNVHALRRVDGKFMDDYMLPILGEDEDIAPHVERLISPDNATASSRPSGVDALLGKADADDDEDVADLDPLMNFLTRRDKRVEVPGTNFVLDRDNLAEAIKAAISTGVRERNRDDKADNKLEAPLSNMKAAIRSIDLAVDALRTVHADPEFDDKRRKSLAAALKKLKRSARQAEEDFSKMSVSIE